MLPGRGRHTVRNWRWTKPSFIAICWEFSVWRGCRGRNGAAHDLRRKLCAERLGTLDMNGNLWNGVRLVWPVPGGNVISERSRTRLGPRAREAASPGWEQGCAAKRDSARQPMPIPSGFRIVWRGFDLARRSLRPLFAHESAAAV